MLESIRSFMSLCSSRAVGPDVIVQSHLPSVNEKEEMIPNPQAVLDHRMRNRRQEILIHWQGLSLADARWEGFDYIKNQFPDFSLEDKGDIEVGEEMLHAHMQHRVASVMQSLIEVE